VVHRISKEVLVILSLKLFSRRRIDGWRMIALAFINTPILK
jgi:hypothetical protein